MVLEKKNKVDAAKIEIYSEYSKLLPIKNERKDKKKWVKYVKKHFLPTFDYFRLVI